MPTSSLSQQLKRTLQELHHNPYPHVPNPSGCTKRAAVALIIRVRPRFPDKASFEKEKRDSETGSESQRLENFFAQEWVQRGDPEVLFIKRAEREGDRWTSHIAFPGGRRDPEDEDDCATSIRETKEEVSLDLSAEHCLRVGNLSERVVTTWLGKTPYVPVSYDEDVGKKMRAMHSSNPAKDGPSQKENSTSGPGELDDTTFTTFQARSRKEIQDSALLEMLGGYYDRAKIAVVATLLLRLGIGGLLAAWGYRKARSHGIAKL
ncbi:MAG: hypothetical protein Q9201_001999 [Fulgogasparrea decipioides]